MSDHAHAVRLEGLTRQRLETAGYTGAALEDLLALALRSYATLSGWPPEQVADALIVLGNTIQGVRPVAVWIDEVAAVSDELWEKLDAPPTT